MLMKLRSPYLLDRVYLDSSARSISQGLVHHCQFFEIGSTKLRDLVEYPIVGGSPAFGTLSGGGVSWVPGRTGYVLNFTASASGNVDWANITNLNFGSAGFTVACWVGNATTTTGSGGSFSGIVCKNQPGNGNAANGWMLLMTTSTALSGTVGAPMLFVCDGTQTLACNSTRTINDGKWHFIMAGRDTAAGVFWISVDGKTRETVSVGTVGSLSGSGDLRYGYRIDGSLNNNYYTGQLDDVHVWNRSLTTGEVEQVYQQRLPSRVNTANTIARLPPAPGTNVLFDSVLQELIVADTAIVYTDSFIQEVLLADTATVKTSAFIEELLVAQFTPLKQFDYRVRRVR